MKSIHLWGAVLVALIMLAFPASFLYLIWNRLFGTVWFWPSMIVAGLVSLRFAYLMWVFVRGVYLHAPPKGPSSVSQNNLKANE